MADSVADRVFIADYIKKKRRRKGSSEYLVKWKGYSSKSKSTICPLPQEVFLSSTQRILVFLNDTSQCLRHCTWEPEKNILDHTLIRQFEDEGYDPRKWRVRLTKRRRRSEVTEARPLSTRFCYNIDRDSDCSTDQDNKGDPHERPFANGSGLSNIWETDFANKTGLYYHRLGHEFKQRGADLQNKSEYRHDFISETSQVQTQHKELEPADSFGGKSCHPKMRAKFLFRSGDFDNSSWGYQLEEAEIDTKESTDSVFEERTAHSENIANDTICEEKSLHSENNINDTVFEEKFIPSENNINDTVFEEKIVPSEKNINDTNGNYLPNLDSLSTVDSPLTPICDKDENGNLDSKMDFDESSQELEVTDTSAKEPLKDKPHEYDIMVTEVTHDCLSVIFMESPTVRGFFKDRNDA